MISRHFALAVLLGTTPLVAAQVATGQTSKERVDLALVGGTVIDVRTGTLVASRTVLISGGRISGVVDARERIPSGVRRINVAGKYLIPGLWDMHVEQALAVWDGAPVDSNASYFFPLFLAHGVTGVRDVAGSLDVLLRWRRQLESGRPGPRLVFTGLKVGRKRPQSPAFDVPNAASLARVLDSLKRGGASDAYVLSLPPEMYPSLAESSRRLGIGFGGLIPPSMLLADAVRYGHRVVEHMDGLMIAATDDESAVRWRLEVSERQPRWARALWKVGVWPRIEDPAWYALQRRSARAESTTIAMLRAAQVYQIPTIRLLANADRASDAALRIDDPSLLLRPPPPQSLGFYGAPVAADDRGAQTHVALRKLIAAMSRSGVPILAGSDPPNFGGVPGRALHDELVLLVASGMSPIEALRAATVRPAEFMHATDSLGTLAPGKVADVVILDADPLADIANVRRVRGVVARGRYFDRAALDALVQQGRVAAAPIAAYWRAKDAKQ